MGLSATGRDLYSSYLIKAELQVYWATQYETMTINLSDQIRNDEDVNWVNECKTMRIQRM